MNSSFLTLYKTGMLKNNPSYRYHYFAKNLVSTGDTVIDLGANLGYYSNLLQQWIGPTGELYSVEPVIPFNEILQWRLKDKKHVTILPYALGTEEKDITLVIPKNLSYLSTGLPNVYDSNSHGNLDEYGFKFEAKMKKGSELFKDLERLDFVKCDIEGYEEYVFPEMKPVFEKHKPIIQVETWGTHKKIVEDFLQGIGYEQFHLLNGKLVPTLDGHDPAVVDFIFIHPANQKADKQTKGLK
ncbi:MAG: FkbM family methyltransferase [Rhizobacter sp.]|nr:FkbM family methyltransferase [Ferruginibacter sp.]